MRSSASPAVLGTSAARATLAQFPRCRIYFDILDWLSALVPLIDKIGRHDPDLAKQLKRASRSVALNCAEGSYAKGGSRIAAYRVSLKEMRESYAGLEIGVRLHYIAPLEPKLEDLCQKILGTLVRLAIPTHR